MERRATGRELSSQIFPEFGAEAGQEQGRKYPNVSLHSFRSPTRPRGKLEGKDAQGLQASRSCLIGHKARQSRVQVLLAVNLQGWGLRGGMANTE